MSSSLQNESLPKWLSAESLLAKDFACPTAWTVDTVGFGTLERHKDPTEVMLLTSFRFIFTFCCLFEFWSWRIRSSGIIPCDLVKANRLLTATCQGHGMASLDTLETLVRFCSENVPWILIRSDQWHIIQKT